MLASGLFLRQKKELLITTYSKPFFIMITVSQLKKHYLKDLFSFRELDRLNYKGLKKSEGYVIGEVNASEIVDSGFWNNDNLINQFEFKNQASSGSRFFDSIMADVMDNETKKQIQKAADESICKLVLYSKEEDKSINADLIFYNKSKNRNMDKALILLDGTPAKLRLKTYSAHFGKTAYEDVITIQVGDFAFFKESVLGKEFTFYFNTDKDEDGEAKDFLGLKFEIKLPLVDVAAVEYIMEGDNWDANYKKNLIPAIEKGLELSNEQTQLDSFGQAIKTVKKRAKTISWVTAVVLFFIIVNIWGEDIEGGLAFLFLLATIAIGMSGKYIGNKLNETKEREYKNKLSDISNRRNNLEDLVKEVYLGQ